MAEQIDQGIWNAAGATLNRVHQLLVHAHECSLGISNSAEAHSPMQVSLWLETLDRIYMEISPYIRDQEDKAIEKVRKEIDHIVTTNKPLTREMLKQPLLKYEFAMRKTKWMQNQLMPRMDDPTLAMRG